MKKTLIIFILGFFISACNNIFDKQIEEKEIERIELVQVEHPLLGGHYNSIILDSLDTKNFLIDFQDRKAMKVKFYSCYVLKIFYKNGELKSYRTNGRCMEILKDTTIKNETFTFNSKENLVSKYWHIDEDNFCILSKLQNDKF